MYNDEPIKIVYTTSFYQQIDGDFPYIALAVKKS